MGDKTSFVLHTSYATAVQRLSDEDAGALFKGLFAYVDSGTAPALSPLADMAFAFIRDMLDRDADKYARTCQRRAEAGRRGGLASGETRSKQSQANEASASKSKQTKQKQANEADGVGVGEGEGDNISPLTPQGEPPAAGEGGKQKRFIPPTVDDVAAYCRERNNGIDPQAFVDHYAAGGWKRGNTPVKDWRACVRTWEQRRKEQGVPTHGNAQPEGRVFPRWDA